MIDGMLAPGAIGLAALAIPILITYMLRSRRPRQVVPSTFLWREATRNVTASRPWQRLKPSVLLILQLLILAALVLAFARPSRQAPGVAGNHLVLVMDASASMLASDDEPSRIEAAKREARRLVETLEAGAVTSVITAGSRPRVLVSASASGAEVRRAIDDVEASEGRADFSEAFLLAESLETPERPTTIAVVSDGGLSQEDRRMIPPGSVFRPVGRSGDNVALHRLDVVEGASGFQAFVEVKNFGSRTRDLELTLELNGSPFRSTPIEVQGGRSAERTFDMGNETGTLVARVDSPDALQRDNRGFAVLERSRPRRILLVTPGSLFLSKLLQSLPGASVEIATEAGDLDGFDLVVFDRVSPAEKIPLPALFVAPASPPKGVVISGEIDVPPITYLAAGDPLLEDVDLSDLAIAKAQRVSVKGGKTLVGTGSGEEASPLMAVWSEGLARRALIAFDLEASNLPLQVAFPIIGDHLFAWLSGKDSSPPRFAGAPLTLAAPVGTDAVRVRQPGGKTAVLSPGEPFTETDRSGFYRVSFLTDGEPLDQKTLGLSFPAEESDLLPRAVEPSPDETRPGLTYSAKQTVVLPLLLAALAMLLVEWWWAHGRPLRKALIPARSRA